MEKFTFTYDPNGLSMKKTKVPTGSEQTATGKSKTAVRGKYFNTLQKQGSNLALIDPELHKHFPNSESVNKALRAFLDIREHLEAVAPPRRTTKRQAQVA